VGVYFLIVTQAFSLPVTLLLCAVYGFIHAMIGFNIAHDAIHGSYSKNATVNKVLSLTMNLIGGNDYMWSITHNNVHHTYTNIPGHDEDIEVAPGLIRLSPEEELKPIMRFQHLYAIPLYGLAQLSWVFRKDYVKFFQPKIGETDNTNHKTVEYFKLFGFKILFYLVHIAVPLMVMDITVWQFLLGFVTFGVTAGVVLGLVFQLAHVVEGPEFPEPDEKNQIEYAWAAHQMRTTANFSRKSRLADLLCGGLNFQVEHHLFPKVCHVHYKHLAPIVKETAEEFGLPYYENKTFIGATMSHYRMLKKFGPDALAGKKQERRETAMAS
jgi:linoleoyl-CoA desaturase